MTEEVTPAPVEEQDQPVTDAPSESTETSATEPTDPFSEKFDPKTLPEELQPAHRQMHADYTRKMQALSEQRNQAQEATAFYQAVQSKDPQALQKFVDTYGEDML